MGLGADDARKYVRAESYSNQNGGIYCFATGTAESWAVENSGIVLYPSESLTPNIFPGNSITTAPWFSLSSESLNLVGSSVYESSICSSEYNIVESQVISLARNNNGTDNQGSTETLSALTGILQTSTSPFVGVDNFYYTARGLNVNESVNFSSTTFESELLATCAQPISGNNLLAQGICANGTFMDTFLFGINGLFNGSSANFAGVLASKQNGTTVLTWTRGYLLLKYAN